MNHKDLLGKLIDSVIATSSDADKINEAKDIFHTISKQKLQSLARLAEAKKVDKEDEDEDEDDEDESKSKSKAKSKDDEEDTKPAAKGKAKKENNDKDDGEDEDDTKEDKSKSKGGFVPFQKKDNKESKKD